MKNTYKIRQNWVKDRNRQFLEDIQIASIPMKRSLIMVQAKTTVKYNLRGILATF